MNGKQTDSPTISEGHRHRAPIAGDAVTFLGRLEESRAYLPRYPQNAIGSLEEATSIIRSGIGAAINGSADWDLPLAQTKELAGFAEALASTDEHPAIDAHLAMVVDSIVDRYLTDMADAGSLDAKAFAAERTNTAAAQIPTPRSDSPRHLL